MEKNKCKLCLRSFANGRALGGHMRSHMLNLQVHTRDEEEEEEEVQIQLGEAAESARSSSSSSSSSSSEEEEGEEDEKGLYYGLRENPKRSIKLVDPEFSFAIDAGSVVLQDRESETESSKNNPTRRRSKRKTRKATSFLDRPNYHHQQQQRQEQQDVINMKKLKFNNNNNNNKLTSKTESWTEPEPVSSISDTTTEEDVAFCLMMLSRDHKWKKKETHQLHEDHHQDKDEEGEAEAEDEDEEEEEEAETDESEEHETKFLKTRSKGKYKCETCNKVFKSYQALGGHRASHKKMKVMTITTTTTAHHHHKAELETENAGSVIVPEKKIHECPVCFRVFSSGQALGGHKRTHVIGVVATAPVTATETATATTKTATTSIPSKFADNNNWIDLNLPAPMDDDDNFSQIELSAVSDAEFVNQIRR